MTTRSSHPVLSYTDELAVKTAGPALLLTRVLIAALFFMTVVTGGPNAAYLGSLGYPDAAVMSTLAHAIEWTVCLSIILGAGLRYGALLGFVFVVIALLTAHRYWELSPAVQGLQYVFFTKDVAIAGGLLALFIAGPGRFSIDEFLKR